MLELLYPWLTQQRLAALKPSQLTEQIKLCLHVTSSYISHFPREIEGTSIRQYVVDILNCTGLWVAMAKGPTLNVKMIISCLLDLGTYA